MRRRGLLAAVALAMAVGACGGADAAECDAVVEEAVDQLQLLLDEVDQMTLEQLSAIDDSFTADLETKIEELRVRKDDAKCSDEDLETLFADKIQRLSSESDFGQLFIDQFTTDNLFDE